MGWLAEKLKPDIHNPIFIIILVIIIAAIGIISYLLFFSAPAFDQNIEVSVLDAQKNPLVNAAVNLVQECGGKVYMASAATDAGGKAALVGCLADAEISVSKKGFKSNGTTISAGDKEAQISLEALPNYFIAPVLVTVKDIDGQLLQKSKLTVICKKGNSVDKNLFNPTTDQPSQGFFVTMPVGCDMIQLKGEMTGYHENTISIASDESLKNIVLEKIITTGTVSFLVSNADGAIADAQVSLTNTLDDEVLPIKPTNYDGEAVFENIKATMYSYVVSSNGSIKTGDFVLNAEELKDVSVYFSDPTPDVNQPDANVIQIKATAGTLPLSGAQVELYQIAKDGSSSINFLTRYTAMDGTIEPAFISDTNYNYKAVVNYATYEIKIIDVVPRPRRLGPVEVSMVSGGVSLVAKIINDLNEPQKDASTNASLYITGFSSPLYRAQRPDTNGNVTFSNLPAGTYRIDANNLTDSGTLNGIVLSEINKTVTVKIITGRGVLKFFLLNAQNNQALNGECDFYEKTGTTFTKLSTVLSVNGACTTSELRVEKQIKMVARIDNYFKYESQLVNVTRTPNPKAFNAYLRKQDELPNTKETQLILRQIYSANPFDGSSNGAVTAADKLMPGGRYYLAFDLVLNKVSDMNTIASFSVSPDDKNTVAGISGDSNIYIADAYSIDNSITLKTDTKAAPFFVDYSAAQGDYPKAKQVNLNYDQQRGPQVIPIILVLGVDANAKGSVYVNYQAESDAQYGLVQHKDFNIGEKFCFSDCPQFLFDTEISWNGRNYAPIENPQKLLYDSAGLDYNYYIQTKVRNTTDKDIGTAYLASDITLDDSNFLSIFPNLTSSIKEITLLPLGQTTNQGIKLTTKKITPTSGASRIVKLTQRVRSANGVISYANTPGNKSDLNFLIRSRKTITLSFNATGVENTLYEKSQYPGAIVNTYFVDPSANMARIRDENAPADWVAYVDGTTPRQYVGQGRTDAGGRQITSLNLTNVQKGAKIIFEASDNYSSASVRREVIVTEAMPASLLAPTNCLIIKVGDTQVTSESDPINLNINDPERKNMQFTVQLDSGIPECRRLTSVTLSVEPRSNGISIDTSNLILDADSSPARIVAYSQSNYSILGIYQVSAKITPLNSSQQPIGNSEYAGKLELNLIDTNTARNCFTIDKTSFNFLEKQSAGGTITNNCFDGRKDIFNPVLAVTKPGTSNTDSSVTVDWKKPGYIAPFDLNVYVVGSAIESVVGCGGVFTNINYGIYTPYYAAYNMIFPRNISADYIQNGLATNLNDICATMDYNGISIAKPEPGVSAEPQENKVSSASFGSFVPVTPENQASPGDPLRKGSYIDIPRDPNALVANGISVVNGSTVAAPSLSAQWNSWAASNNISTSSCGPLGCQPLTDAYNSALQDNMYSRGLAWIPLGNPLGVNVVSERPFPYATDVELLWGQKNGQATDFYGNLLNIPQLNPTESGSGVSSSIENWLDLGPAWTGTINETRGQALILCPPANNTNPEQSSQYCLEAVPAANESIYVKSADLGNGVFYLKVSRPMAHYHVNQYAFGFQFGELMKKELLKERRAIFIGTIHIVPNNGANQDSTSYLAPSEFSASAIPAARWTNMSSYSTNSEWNRVNNTPLKVGDVQIVSPNGLPTTSIFKVLSVAEQTSGYSYGSNATSFVNPERALEASTTTGHPWTVKPASDPLVEYDATGKIMYSIPQAYANILAASGVKVYLQNGEVRAEYTGTVAQQGVTTPNIDFNITNVSVFDTNYSDLTVTDWAKNPQTGVLEKKSRTFRVKIKAGAANCFSPTGEPGYTGTNYAPRLKFNWDWNAINYNECDSNNVNYSYCDAAQFTVSLFKRLPMLNNALSRGDSTIPTLSGFYAYLMKDNYTQYFLDAFKAAYPGNLVADTTFRDREFGYDQFIRDSAGRTRIHFFTRDSSGAVSPGANLSSAGMYRVEIQPVYENSDDPAIMGINGPVAELNITFQFAKDPPYANPLYELPFDGPVGQTSIGTDTLAWRGMDASTFYGTSKILKIQDGIIPESAQSLIDYEYDPQHALVNLNVSTDSNLSRLNNGTVLEYYVENGVRQLKLLSTKPTPVILTINGLAPSAVHAEYFVNPSTSTSNFQKTWRIIDSNLDTTNSFCIDFSNKQPVYYTDTGDGSTNKRQLNWSDSSKSGYLKLATTFFAPNYIGNAINVNLGDQANVKIDSYSSNDGKSASISSYVDSRAPYFGSVKEILGAVKAQKMCVGPTQNGGFKVWWNQKYLNTLIRDLAASTGSSSASLTKCFPANSQ
ncbi:Carboxypeptidase regulatory-like domain protein [uncultured archaeon]|nr:Carboxypeptidase regulatory-like domain protein [uncultured archaeon]